MRADSVRVRVGEPFHLAIHVRVRENVAALDELQIPDVGTMQVLGDERHTTHSPAGTDVTETLTLEPVARGRFTFAPAYLDAIDARDRKPKRFSANHPVTVVVDAPLGVPALAGEDLGLLLRRLLGGALIVLGLVAAVVLLVLLDERRRRREPPVVPAPQPTVAPPPPPRTPRDEVAAALRAYRVAPRRRGARRAARRAVRRGRRAPGATLRDALGASGDQRLRAALLAAERAAFGPAHARDAASAELVDADRGLAAMSRPRDLLAALHATIVGQDTVVEGLVLGLIAGGHVLLEGAPGRRQDAGLPRAGGGGRRQVPAGAVHPRPAALRRGRHAHLRPEERRVRDRARPAVRQRRAGRRDQPRAGQGAVGAARGDAGAARDDRPADPRPARAVRRAGDDEPLRRRRHLPAAARAARPLPGQAGRRVPVAATRSARSSTASAAPSRRCARTSRRWPT